MFDGITWLTQILWRNGLAIVPAALIVWGLARWGVRRPATRHALWLGALAWLVAGVMFSPMAFEAAVECAPADVDHSGDMSAANTGRVTESQGKTKPGADCEFVCDAASNDGSVEPELLAHSRKGMNARERSLASAARAAHTTESPHSDSATLKRNPPVDATDQPDERDPTPPTAIVRPDGPASTHLIAAQDSVGQSPPFHRAVEPVVGAERDSPACLTSGASIAPVARAGGDDGGSAEVLKERTVESSANTLSDAMPAFADETADITSDQHQATDSVGALETSGLREWVAAWVRVRDSIGAIPTIPVSLWLGVAALLMTLKVVACIRFRRRLRGARAAPHRVRAMVRACAESIGLRTVPETVFVKGRLSPMVVCGWRPRLVLPVALWAELDPAGRRAVVVHELAHLRRRDHLTHWFDCLVGVVYWWHPVVWWVRQRLRDEAENACDAWVTWFEPRERRAYATALLRARTFLNDQRGIASAPAVGVMSPQAKRFSRRLTMVMTSRVSPKAYSLGILAIPVLFLSAWVSMPAVSEACPPKEESASKPIQYIRADEPDGGSKSWVVVSDGDQSLEANRIILADQFGLPVHVVKVGDDDNGAYGVAYEVADGERAKGGVAVVAKGKPAAGDRDTDARLDRLEHQMAELSEKLSVLIEQRAGRWRAAPRAPAVPRAPAAPTPMAPRMVPPPSPTPSAPPAMGLYTTATKMVTRRYELPDGKLAALTKLMSRSDVPTHVSAVPGGIQVYASEADQAKFAAFVEMITGEGMDDTHTYKVSKGKFDDLVELMARNDVPVLINYDDGEITVHGGGLIQKTFREFVEMIDPSAKSKSSSFFPATGASAGAVAPQGDYAAALNRYRELAKAAANRSRHELKSQVKARQKQIREFREQRRSRIQELMRAAGMIEAHVDRLTDKLDEMQAKAHELTSRIEATTSKRVSDELRAALEEVNSAIDEIKSQIDSLRSQAEANENQADEIEAEADHLEAQAEEPEEMVVPDRG